ncbi:MAG: hypothetical protein GDA39_06940 [Hyphomonadaceae bacterium]|nr:hypothetical protein [Hyphomonadaceae bacterium]
MCIPGMVPRGFAVCEAVAASVSTFTAFIRGAAPVARMAIIAVRDPVIAPWRVTDEMRAARMATDNVGFGHRFALYCLP